MISDEFGKLEDPKAASHDALSAAAGARFALAEADLPELEKYKLNPDLPSDKLKEALKKLTGIRADMSGKYMDVVAMGSPEWSIASIYRLGYCYEKHAKLVSGMGLPKMIKKLPPDVRPEAEKMFVSEVDEVTAPMLTEAKSYYVKAIDLAKSSGIENEWTSKAKDALKELEAAATPAP